MAERRRVPRKQYTVAGTMYSGSSAYVLQERITSQPAYRPRNPAYEPKERSQQTGSGKRYPAKKRQGFSGMMIMSISLAIVLFTCGFMAILQVQYQSDIQKQIAQTQKEIKTYREKNELLEQELARAVDGEIIRNYAVNKLGMVKTSAENVRTISVVLPYTDEIEEMQQETSESKVGLLDVLIDLLD